MSMPSAALHNRIREHRQVRAGDLLPHPLNWRRHPDAQRAALEALYEEIGFARSLLAYALPDGRLRLIDGHLRRDLTPDEVVTVEVLDVNDDEARKLLLSMDPLAALAHADEEALTELRRLSESDQEILNAFWDQVAASAQMPPIHDAGGDPSDKIGEPEVPEQFLILITCDSEQEQTALLDRLSAEGIACKPLSSYGE